MSKVPTTLWAQREDCVYLTLEIADCKDPTVELEDAGTLKFSGVGGTDKEKYELSLEFFGAIAKAESKIQLGQRNIFMWVKKAEVGPYWDRLLKEKGKPHFLKTDFNKWKDEDDEEDVGASPGFDLSQMGDMSQFADDADDGEDSDDEDIPGLETAEAPVAPEPVD